jgi:hypothetical protein
MGLKQRLVERGGWDLDHGEEGGRDVISITLSGNVPEAQ